MKPPNVRGVGSNQHGDKPPETRTGQPVAAGDQQQAEAAASHAPFGLVCGAPTGRGGDCHHFRMRGRDDCGRHNLDPELVEEAEQYTEQARDPFWRGAPSRAFYGHAVRARSEARRLSRQGARQARTAHRRASSELAQLGYDPEQAATVTDPHRVGGHWTQSVHPPVHETRAPAGDGLEVVVRTEGRGTNPAFSLVGARPDGTTRRLAFHPDAAFAADPELVGQRHQQALSTMRSWKEATN